ncbi:conserved hypothetical protein [Clostridiaceae bacterium BL-3]|uniref:hypothetical protein n=1 Tax=Muricomes intestini TaxID=1796634 RepID=UPI00156CCE64|nr:conserved hypothetical protein [Clostridiaceae bacterium BL-3]
MSRHHRSHSRRQRSNIKDINDESYYIDDERSIKNYDPTDIDENQEESNTTNSNDENTLNNLSENTSIVGVNNSSYSNHEKHHSNSRTSIRSISFIDNLKKYIGKTVTVYTTGGDSCRYNFTGTLLGVNNYFIRLAIKSCPSPVYQTRTNFNDNLDISSDPYSSADNCNSESNPCPEDTNSGTIADIPIDKIAALLRSNV